MHQVSPTEWFDRLTLERVDEHELELLKQQFPPKHFHEKLRQLLSERRRRTDVDAQVEVRVRREDRRGPQG